MMGLLGNLYTESMEFTVKSLWNSTSSLISSSVCCLMMSSTLKRRMVLFAFRSGGNKGEKLFSLRVFRHVTSKILSVSSSRLVMTANPSWRERTLVGNISFSLSMVRRVSLISVEGRGCFTFILAISIHRKECWPPTYFCRLAEFL